MSYAHVKANLRRVLGVTTAATSAKSVTVGFLPPRRRPTAIWALVAALSVIFTYALTCALEFLFLAYASLQAVNMAANNNHSFLGS